MPYTTNVGGTTITASWGNANVRDQVVTPFASTSARDSAITSPVAGMLCITTDMGYLWRHNGSKWIRLEATVVCTADTSWTSTTTATAIPNGNTVPNGGLGFAVDANASYEFALDCHLIGNTSVSLAATLNQPSGARADWMATGLNNAGTLYNGGALNQTGTSNLVGSFTTANFGMVGLIQNGANAGTLSFTFAQGTSNAATSWVLIGTRLVHRQVS